MTAQPTFWDIPQLAQERHQRTKARRRALTLVEPLSGRGMDAGKLADAILLEHQSSLSCHRRATTNLKQAVERGAPVEEQRLLIQTLDEAGLRIARNRARLIQALAR